MRQNGSQSDNNKISALNIISNVASCTLSTIVDMTTLVKGPFKGENSAKKEYTKLASHLMAFAKLFCILKPSPKALALLFSLE